MSSLQRIHRMYEWSVEHRLIRTDRPWGPLIEKIAVFCLVLFGAAPLFFSRFSIAMDLQSLKCIPEHTLWLIDHEDKTPVRDAIYAFASKDLSPVYPEGTRMIKYLRGLPGDDVEIGSDLNVMINGKFVAWGLTHAEKLGKTPEYFQGAKTLGEGQYWFLGTSPQSFDSRYWGGMSHEAIIGRAHPIF